MESFNGGGAGKPCRLVSLSPWAFLFDIFIYPFSTFLGLNLYGLSKTIIY